MNIYIQFTERPIESLHLPPGGGVSSGPTRLGALDERIKQPDAPVTDFRVLGAEGELVCAGRYMGGEKDRDFVLEKVRIYAANVDDVDPVRIEFEDGKAFRYDAEIDCVVPTS